MSLFAAEEIAINFGGIKAVDGVSFAIEKGEVFTIIGPNGAGKTTIFNLRLEIEHREAVEQVIDFLDLQQYRDSLIVNLPYGVRKVTELARALCTQPKLLLLDEPSSGLNVEETEDMAFWIQDIKNLLGITVLMVEHDMTLVSAVSDRVLALNYGRPLATGTPREVQSHPEVMRAYLGG